MFLHCCRIGLSAPEGPHGVSIVAGNAFPAGPATPLSPMEGRSSAGPSSRASSRTPRPHGSPFPAKQCRRGWTIRPSGRLMQKPFRSNMGRRAGQKIVDPAPRFRTRGAATWARAGGGRSRAALCATGRAWGSGSRPASRAFCEAATMSGAWVFKAPASCLSPRPQAVCARCPSLLMPAASERTHRPAKPRSPGISRDRETFSDATGPRGYCVGACSERPGASGGHVADAYAALLRGRRAPYLPKKWAWRTQAYAFFRGRAPGFRRWRDEPAVACRGASPGSPVMSGARKGVRARAIDGRRKRAMLARRRHSAYAGFSLIAVCVRLRQRASRISCAGKVEVLGHFDLQPNRDINGIENLSPHSTPALRIRSLNSLYR